jgi:CheY-like chemotaxis protein
VTEEASHTQQVILIVEDEILIRMVIADYLRSCGYRVIEAASATRTAQFAAGLVQRCWC